MTKDMFSKDNDSYKMMRFNKDGLSVELPVKEMVFPFDDSEIGYINCKGKSSYIINKNKEILSEEYAYCKKATDFIIHVSLPIDDRRGDYNFINKEGNLISDNWFMLAFNGHACWVGGFMTVDINKNHHAYYNILNEYGKLLSDIPLSSVKHYKYIFESQDKKDIRTEYIQYVENENNEWNIYWQSELLYEKWLKQGDNSVSSFSQIYCKKYNMKECSHEFIFA